MTRLLCSAVVLTMSGSAFAQCASPAPFVYSNVPVVFDSAPVAYHPVPAANGGGLGAGLLARLNAPLLSGLPTTPGLPSVSPLGLLAPRVSFAASFLQAGGFSAPNPGQYLIGLAAPRLAPLAALQAGTIQPQQAVLGVIAPRATVGLQLVQGLQANGGGRFGGRFCR